MICGVGKLEEVSLKEGVDMDVEEGLSLKKKETRDKGVPPSRDGSRNKQRYGEEVADPERREGRFLQIPHGKVLRSYPIKDTCASRGTMR